MDYVFLYIGVLQQSLKDKNKSVNLYLETKWYDIENHNLEFLIKMIKNFWVFQYESTAFFCYFKV
jgi:glycerophosphoryl diester phosphodiesterase